MRFTEQDVAASMELWLAVGGSGSDQLDRSSDCFFTEISRSTRASIQDALSCAQLHKASCDGAGAFTDA